MVRFLVDWRSGGGAWCLYHSVLDRPDLASDRRIFSVHMQAVPNMIPSTRQFGLISDCQQPHCPGLALAAMPPELSLL